MDDSERQRFEATLRQLRSALLDEGDLRAEPNRTDDHGRRDDDAQPLNEMLQSIASSRNQNRATVLRRVNAALQRLEDDPEMFGLCEECEEPIPPRRMELMPYVELCVRCQSEREEAEKPTGRRKLGGLH